MTGDTLDINSDKHHTCDLFCKWYKFEYKWFLNSSGGNVLIEDLKKRNLISLNRDTEFPSLDASYQNHIKTSTALNPYSFIVSWY